VTRQGEPPLIEVILNRSYASRREVIEAIGEIMVASSAVTAPYVDGMLRKEEQGGTIVTAEVALPHGTEDVKHAVRRNALVIVPIPNGVEWMPGQRVRLAIGFAGAGDDGHLRVLAAVARMLSDEDTVSRLKTATERLDVADLLDQLAAPQARPAGAAFADASAPKAERGDGVPASDRVRGSGGTKSPGST
jgi:mannitol/fructose-specific phosphotransferase system IIA component